MIYDDDDDTADLSRSRDGDQQRGHRHHARRPVDHHRRLQRPHLDRSVAVLPVHRSQQSSTHFIHVPVRREPAAAAAAPTPLCRRPASIVGRSVQR